MHWILHDRFFSNNASEHLLETLQRLDLPYSLHKVVPFVGELIPAPELAHHNVICFGAYSMRHAARRYGWSPGVFDLHDVSFPVQLAHWGKHLLNAGATVCRFADARFDAATLFVRPVHDSKDFAGKLYDRDEFIRWQQQVCAMEDADPASLNANTLIQLSPPQTLYAEYRLWVVKGKIITFSLYKRGAQVIYAPEFPATIQAWAEARIAEWQPSDAFVLDVCDTPDGPRIVEINTLNAAGFYAANLPRLVMALEEAFHQA